MSKKFRLITNITAGTLALIFVLLATSVFFRISEDLKQYPASVENMVYSVEAGSYSTLVRSYRKNQAIVKKPSAQEKECYAVAHYYETAVGYRIALSENDIKTAEKLKKELSDIAGDMGSLSYAKDDIDKLLEDRGI